MKQCSALSGQGLLTPYKAWPESACTSKGLLGPTLPASAHSTRRTPLPAHLVVGARLLVVDEVVQRNNGAYERRQVHHLRHTPGSCGSTAPGLTLAPWLAWLVSHATGWPGPALTLYILRQEGRHYAQVPSARQDRPPAHPPASCRWTPLPATWTARPRSGWAAG